METVVHVNGSVDHIELDRYRSNHLISVGHELRTCNLENGRLSVIVGNQNKESSYREGPGTTVYFEQITGFVQTSNDFVVVVST